MNQTPHQPQDEQAGKAVAQKMSRGSKLAVAGVFAAYAGAAAFLWQQDKVVELVQASSVEAVHDFAVAAAVVAQDRCAQPGVAGKTYENIVGLYENRVILRMAPYTAGSLAPVLENLNDHKIAVQGPVPSYGMGLDTDAVFEKGAADSEGVLTVRDAARYNGLLKTFLATLPEQAEGLKAGEKLVLHSTFMARSSDEAKYQVVKVAAGATDYQVLNGRNPFPSGKRYALPVYKCEL